MEFAGKTVLITGAAGVYGRAFAAAFAAEGAQLALVDQTRAKLQAMVEEAKLGGHPKLFACDLADAAAVARLVAEVAQAAGCPDIVVNNAGLYPFAGLFDTSAELWDRIMGVNLRAPFLMVQGFARLMIERGVKGCFVNIGSGAAHVLRTNGLAYCASKRGLDWLSRGMALELGPHGIRVNVLEPGVAVGSDAVVFPPGYVETLGRDVPLGAGEGPRDVADALLFLCSERARYVTGASLAVDGGSAIPRRPRTGP